MSAVDNYLINIAGPERAELERIRRIVKAVVPEAEEVITYGMPGFKYKNKYLAGYNALKNHLSFFPTSAPIEMYKEKLKGFSLSRGTVRFTLDRPIPESLIKDLILKRVHDIDAT